MSFIDLHNHCFTAMDAGVQSQEEALMMLKTAVKSDIKIMYVTPHREPNGRFDPNNETVLKAWRKLRKLASVNDLDIDVRYGEEFRIKIDSIDLIKNNQVLCYHRTDYVLIEFTRTNVFSKLVDQAIELLHEQGKNILIAHPERYFDDINEAVKTCRNWVKQGCYLQINRTSLTGFHGIYPEKIAHKLIKLGLAHVVATDAHEGEGARTCRLDDVYFQTIKKHNQAQADLLFIINPKHLSLNEALESVIKPKRHLKLPFEKKRRKASEKNDPKMLSKTKQPRKKSPAKIQPDKIIEIEQETKTETDSLPLKGE
jgi:protein-tyrosine phosphatase